MPDCHRVIHAEGSPPRVRSRRLSSGLGRRSAGITSACAEQTLDAEINTSDWKDHLRVCGADLRRLRR